MFLLILTLQHQFANSIHTQVNSDCYKAGVLLSPVYTETSKCTDIWKFTDIPIVKDRYFADTDIPHHFTKVKDDIIKLPIFLF